MADDTGFIRRWSRRKAQAQDGVRRRHGGAQPVMPAAPVAEAAGQVDPTDPLASLGEPQTPESRPPEGTPQEEAPPVDLDALPEIDSLDDSSDYTPFMQAGVPDELRTKALKRLWQLDPTFNEVDGLVEYGEDFSISRTIAKSLYRVGKGMLTDEEHATLDADSPYVAPEDSDADAAPDAASGTPVETAEQMAGSGPEDAPGDETSEKGNNSQTHSS